MLCVWVSSLPPAVTLVWGLMLRSTYRLRRCSSGLTHGLPSLRGRRAALAPFVRELRATLAFPKVTPRKGQSHGRLSALPLRLPGDQGLWPAGGRSDDFSPCLGHDQTRCRLLGQSLQRPFTVAQRGPTQRSPWPLREKAAGTASLFPATFRGRH